MDRCKRCLRRVRWERTHPGGKPIMLDIDPSAAGTIRVVGIDDQEEMRAVADSFLPTPIQSSPIGQAVLLSTSEREGARELGWELHTVHAATCPAPDQSAHS